MGNRTAGTERGRAGGWLFALTHWNWKVALLTAGLRGAACVAALWHMEFHARRHFGLVEAAFVLLTCGFFSALQQQSLQFRLEALAWLACVVVVPLTSLSCDAGLHFWLDGRSTRQLGLAGILYTLVSATFHWHMIRNGALLVGDEEASLGKDLGRIPRLVGTYFAAPVMWVRKSTLAAVGGEAEESAVA
ncbi:MAG TPA: hypothetical protein VHX37_01050 [Acidobacteriaceae bacterium]|nr:hypothetical protein [Acidobacteriaceae bacterium]